MKKVALIVGVSTLSLLGCKKEGPQGPQGPAGPQGAQGPAGPTLTGDLVGYVRVYDEYGVPQAKDNVTVTIGSSTGSAVTDANGKYIFTNLNTGTYELNFSKTGYQSSKEPSVIFTGGGTTYWPGSTALTKAPNFTVTSVNFQNIGGTINYTVNVSSTDPKDRRVMLFLGTNSNVSSTPSSYLDAIQVYINPNQNAGYGSIWSSFYTNNGITSGTTVYAIAYPISNAVWASTYLDVNTGKTFYNNLNTSGASAVNSFTAP